MFVKYKNYILVFRLETIHVSKVLKMYTYVQPVNCLDANQHYKDIIDCC